MADDARDDILRQTNKLGRQLEEKLKAIPDNLSDDVTARMVQQYCQELGFSCSDEQARRMVREAREKFRQ
jgi:hypothetical protein